jgi:hypothetical protein
MIRPDVAMEQERWPGQINATMCSPMLESKRVSFCRIPRGATLPTATRLVWQPSVLAVAEIVTDEPTKKPAIPTF